MSGHTAGSDKKHAMYWGIGAALLLFTGLTVGANLIHLPVHQAIAVALIIASIKASMVAMVFMHLSQERRWIYGSLLITAAFFAMLILIPTWTIGDTIGTPIHSIQSQAADAAHER